MNRRFLLRAKDKLHLLSKGKEVSNLRRLIELLDGSGTPISE